MNKGCIQRGEIELSEEVEVYRNDFAILYDDKVKFPGGAEGRYVRFQWNAPYGVALDVRNPAGGLLLIKTFRHDSRCWTWQLPKGFGSDTLSPLQTAQKELKEETGMHSEIWQQTKVLHENGIDVHRLHTTISDPTPLMTLKNNEQGEVISQLRFFTPAECRDILSHQRPEYAGVPVLDLITLLTLSEI
ncbi:MAG: NUDIX domain-containing protein [Idiomarina sp.]|nr:NUDIX domain-containing protein [Idiomarina sp.]